MDHLSATDFESGAGGDGGGRCQTQPQHRRERLFAHKVARGKKRDGSFLPGWGNHSDLCVALLKIENRVRGISLRKEGFLRRQLDDSSPQAGTRKESGGIEFRLFKFNHGSKPSLCGPRRMTTGRMLDHTRIGLTKQLRDAV